MWHFTDVFYHTDADRLDMVSAEEMKNVGISALAAAYTLTAADESVTLSLIDEVKTNAFDRLSVEYTLSKEAIQKGAVIKEEQHILEVWTAWYKTALEKMTDINIAGVTTKINARILSATKMLDLKSKNLIKSLERK